MTIKQSQFTKALQRPLALLMVIGLLVSTYGGVAYAAATGGQVQYRSIKMSDNGPSDGTIPSGVGSGIGVTYRVTFQAASSYNLKGVVVDFCRGTGGTPFIGDTNCAALPNFTVGNTPTVDTSAYSFQPNGAAATAQTSYNAIGTTSNWVTTSTNSGQTFKMKNETDTIPLTTTTNQSTPVYYSFAISGIRNTSDLDTFYARLITYSDVSNGGSYDNYAHADAGTYQDYGGFALSTARIVQVTAKVQETLSFCVSDTTDQTVYPATTQVAPTSCADVSAPAIILGHGTNQTLDPSAVDRNTVWTIASTNALQGLSIRLRNSNACGGLSTDNGTTCPIAPAGSGAATAGPLAVGTAFFGMFCYESDTGQIGGADVIGTATCDSNYRDPAHVTSPTDVYYGMDTLSTGENVTSTYGDVIVRSTGPVSNVRNRYDFAASASNTTPAGIYRANMAMIATGKF